MCGIVGLINPSGLTEANIEKFVGMLKRCQTRGIHATGIFTSNMKMLKAPLPSQIFVTANKFKEFITSQLQQGMTYIVGHTRQATRGDPKINSNNHPFAGTDNKFMLVHNGGVTCAKYDKDITITDTYAIVEGINSFLPNRAVSEAVKLGFEDVERVARSNNSVIVVGESNKVIFCKSRVYPMIIQTIEESGVILFASTIDIMEPEVNITIDGVKKKRWEEVNNEVIVTIDIATRQISRQFLATKELPTFTSFREAVDVPEVDIDDFVKDSTGKWVRKSSTSSTLDDFTDTKQTSKNKKKHKKNKHKSSKNIAGSSTATAIHSPSSKQRSALTDWDRERSAFDENDVENYSPDDRPVDCFDCISSSDLGDDEQELLVRIRQGTVDCAEFGYEMNATEARRCPFFVPRDTV